jgi:hypothetical protein
VITCVAHETDESDGTTFDLTSQGTVTVTAGEATHLGELQFTAG